MHKTVRYNRSEILSYYDLTPTQQVNVVSNYYNNNEQAEQDSYVLIDDEHSPLPLSMFMRNSYGKLWHGSYQTSNTGGYYIRINRHNDSALVVERYW